MNKKKIVVFSPHADDAEIAMGGTIAKLSKKNKVTIVTAIIPNENILGEKNKYMIDNRLKEQKKSQYYRVLIEQLFFILDQIHIMVTQNH